MFMEKVSKVVEHLFHPNAIFFFDAASSFTVAALEIVISMEHTRLQ